MSIVCAVREPGKGVWVGCDSQITNGTRYIVSNLSKICIHGKWALGSAGDIRIINILQDDKSRLLRSNNTIKQIVNRLRSLFEQEDISGAQTQDGGGVLYPASFVLTDGRKIWSIGHDCSIIEKDDFHAIGAGKDFSYGAHYALKSKHTKRALETCLMAACANEIYCRPPLKIELIPE